VNLVWVVFLIGLGFLNLYVAFNYSLDAWVNFKLFGVTGMMFVFIIAQTVLLRKYLIEPTDENPVNEITADEKIEK
jgi:intracellular septation protein